MIKVEGLSRRYGSIQAVSDFSLAVAPGEIFALVGPDGAGKTTIMRCLCNLIVPDAGTMLIAGLPVARQFDSIKPLVGYMPQSFSLYPDLSVAENLRFYAGLHGVTGERYRQRCDSLYGFSNLRPFARRRAGALSGGMKQKLALSCALIHGPRLLILDEPTTGVDPVSRRQFWEILLTLKEQGVAILVSTPYMDEVARADRGAFIHGGRKLAEGTPGQLAALFDGDIYYLDADPSPDLVAAIDAIDGLNAQRFGAGLHVYVKRGDRMEQYHPPLAAIGVDVSALKPIPPQLEDAFVRLMETRA